MWERRMRERRMRERRMRERRMWERRMLDAYGCLWVGARLVACLIDVDTTQQLHEDTAPCGLILLSHLVRRHA